MDKLSWLPGHRFRDLVRRDFDWVVHFDENTSLVIECLWRLVEDGRIRLTSEDHGHQFGLPAPVDAAAEVTSLLGGKEVIGLEVREGLLDMDLRFGSGLVLQVIPTSSGYEAWRLTSGSKLLIAVGGGELATFDSA